jgi:hypothetical protein
MAALNFFIGLWLIAAPAAQAQRVVVSVAGLGRTVATPAILSAPPVLAPAMTIAAMPLAPALSAPAAVSIAPRPIAASPAAAPLKLSAGTAALAQFAKLDLKSAPAAEAKGASDALMARLLGAEGTEAASETLAAPSSGDVPLAASSPKSAQAPAPRVNLLSKPLHETVELGRVARFLHYALETAMQFVKAGIAWHATGSPAAAGAVLAFELVKMPPMITAQSLADLGLRYWWRKLTTLKKLSDTPGVTRIRVLTTGDAEFSGMLAVKKENTGLVFMDSSEPLPEEISSYGAPIGISNLATRKVRLTLIHDGKRAAVDWTPTLGQLLSGKPIPRKAAAAWRAALEARNKGKSRLRRLLDFSKDKEIRVEASLEDGAGGEQPLGTIVFGKAVKKLVGLGRLDRLGALVGRKPASRAIPLSDTIVERGGEREVSGFARRAWMRLTGALIVRP